MSNQEIIRVLTATIFLLLSVLWGWYREQHFLDFIDRIFASFGGLVAGAILTWIVYTLTKKTEIPEQFQFLTVQKIQAKGFYRTNYLIKFILEQDIKLNQYILTFSIRSLIIPVKPRGVKCVPIGLVKERPQWSKDIDYEYWQFGEQLETDIRKIENINDRPEYDLVEPTIEHYSYRCPVKNERLEISDDHIFTYPVDKFTVEAILPSDWSFEVFRDKTKQKLTIITSSSDNAHYVSSFKDIATEGTKFKWSIKKTDTLKPSERT